MFPCLIPVILAFAPPNAGDSANADVKVVLRKLPDPFGKGSSADAYLDAAVLLQKMGKDKAVEALREFADDDDDGDKWIDPVFVLCRMLFVPKKDGTFRRPMIGAPKLIAGSKTKDWPLEPIEIIDGVPFVVARGYRCEGLAERSRDYLRYCLRECAWNPYQFSPKTGEAKQIALMKLLVSKRFREQLEESDLEFFWSQIK